MMGSHRRQHLLLFILLPIAQAVINDDGLCSLFIFAPFSIASKVPSGTLSGLNQNVTNKGFSHMAAALLAIDHFNKRNTTIVPELADYEECTIRFDLNKTRVFDTGSVTHKASQSLWEQDIVPCAMVGPFNGGPAIELSVLATAAKIPMVAHRAHNLRITSDHLSPYSSQIFPGTISSAHKLVEFLHHKGRSDYIGVLYSLTDTGVQRREALAIELDDSHMEWTSAGYTLDHDYENEHGSEIDCNGEYAEWGVDHSECGDNHNGRERAVQVLAFNLTFDEKPEEENVQGDVFDEENTDEVGLEGDQKPHDVQDEEHGHQDSHADGHVDGHSILGALRKIKESGYRTIVVAMEFPDGDLPLIAGAAERLGMNGGEYLWIWYDMFEPGLAHSENSNITKLIAGSALLMPLSAAFLQPETDPFAKAWKSQGKEDVDRLNAANPINAGQVGYIFADDDWFQTVDLEWGSDFLFDAVMAVGIGACLAEQVSTGTISSIDHQRSIRQAIFSGATGSVAFGGEGKSEKGARDPRTVSWAEINVLPPQSSGNETAYFPVTGVYDPVTNQWHHVSPFVYRDGRRETPELLRDEPDQNYLSSGLRIMGYTLMSIALLGAIVSVLWVYHHQTHRVVRASQPVFLYLIAFGAAVEALTIAAISNDESYGWSIESLSIACMVAPWLLASGHIIIYSALFTKLWRINKVLQFSRRKVNVSHVAAPMVLIVILALLVLSLWTVLDPLVWTRVEINDVTGESIGECSCERFAAYIVPLLILMLIPTVLTALMAWKTMDVDEAYAESRWIFTLILVQLEVVVIAVPLVFILRDVSTGGRYLGSMFMLWVFPMSTLILIFLPKYAAYRKTLDNNARSVRGQRTGGVAVSGVALSIPKESYISNKGGTNSGTSSSVPTHSTSEASIPQEVSESQGRSQVRFVIESSVPEEGPPEGIDGIESDSDGEPISVFNDESSASDGDGPYS